MTSSIKSVSVAVLWKLLGRRRLVRLGRFLSFEARLDGACEVYSLSSSIVRNVLARNSPRSRVLHVLDVGANVGDWTRTFFDACAREGWVDMHIHVFEPSSLTFETLRKRLLSDPVAGRVSFSRLALSRKAGRASLNIVHDLAGTNSLHVLDAFPASRAEEVQLATVREYVEEKGIERVLVMKVDTEGHEMEVLAGAGELLAEQRIEIIQFEYNACWIDSRHFLREAFELLEPLGYKLGKLTRMGVEVYQGWDAELESFRPANYLAFLPEWLEFFPTVPWWND